MRSTARLTWATPKLQYRTSLAMNFQAVSVGQKLIEGTVKGGYLDGAGTPSPKLLDAIEYVDDSIGQMVADLKKQGLLDTTLIIVTAKHGQSPIDPHRFQEVGKGPNPIMTTPADVIASFLPPPPAPQNPTTPDKTLTVIRPPFTAGQTLGAIGPTQDDISL